jgi:cytochrome c6
MTTSMKSVSKFAVWAAALAALCFLVPASRAQDNTDKTYKAKCVMCHAADGSGSPVGKKMGTHDFRGEEVQKMTDAYLTDALAKGKNKMPGYEKTMKPDEIKDMVAYIRAMAPKK